MQQNRRLSRVLIAIFLCVAASVVAVHVSNADQVRPVAVSAGGPTTVAGVTYRVQASRPLDEAGDGAAVRALPERERHPAVGDALYGVFVSAANTGVATQPLARRFELIDASLQRFAQVQLAAGSAYRYRAGKLPPGGRAPADVSPVAENMAEEGYPLVFRMPRGVDGQRLTLLIHDPTGAASPGEIIVQA